MYFCATFVTTNKGNNLKHIKKTKVMKFFNIKKGRKSETVQCESMSKLNQYCNENGYTNWQMLGMMSISELEYNKKNCRVIA